MPVQLNPQGGPSSFPLTSPPKEYEIKDSEWIASEINFTDRKVAITHPFPDKIDLVAPISEHTQCFPDLSGKSALQKAIQLDHEIKDHLKAFPACDGINLRRVWPPHDPRKATVRFESDGSHLGFVELWRTNNEGFPSWWIRLEFNPRRLGLVGLRRLRARFEEAFCMLSLGSILREASMSRLDVAVDILGVLPIDLIPRVKGLGKTQTYHSPSGALESRLFFGEKLPSAKPVKSVGPLRLKIYDKVAEGKAKAQPSPFTSDRITRLEVLRSWRSHRPRLDQILHIKNPLAGIEVAYSGQDHLASSKLWRRTLEKALAYGIDNVPVEHPVGQSLKLISIYKTIAPDILSAASWARWGQGCSLTGVLGWIMETCEGDFPSLQYILE